MLRIHLAADFIAIPERKGNRAGKHIPFFRIAPAQNPNFPVEDLFKAFPKIRCRIITSPVPLICESNGMRTAAFEIQNEMDIIT